MKEEDKNLIACRNCIHSVVLQHGPRDKDPIDADTIFMRCGFKVPKAFEHKRETIATAPNPNMGGMWPGWYVRYPDWVMAKNCSFFKAK